MARTRARAAARPLPRGREIHTPLSGPLRLFGRPHRARCDPGV